MPISSVVMDTAAQRAEQALDAWVSREPILTKAEHVAGYELLCRQNSSEVAQSATNTPRDVIDTVNLLGLEALCDGRLAFIKSTPEMLLGDQFLLLPPDRLVIEIPTSIPEQPELVTACRELKTRGYRFALDNGVSSDPRRPLAELADYVKVDTRNYSAKEIATLVSEYSIHKCQLVTTRVETRAHFEQASQSGFGLFQGYFFRTLPGRVRARHFSHNEASRLQLLQAVSSAELDIDKIEELIKQDPALCYRLLRYLNSPLLGFSHPVESVRHGINLVGQRELARWVRIATTVSLGQRKCSDLVLSALVRGRFCELIASKLDPQKMDLFLFGMLTIMDSILEVPMGIIVESLPFDPETKAEILSAKVGRDAPLTRIYRLVLARELGEWEEIAVLAKKLNLSLPFISRTYNSAMIWAGALVGNSPGGQRDDRGRS